MSSLLRSLPDFRGKRRLARILYRSLIIHGKDIEVNGKYQCHYTLPNLKENLSLDLFVNGVYEQETIDFFVNTIPKNGIFMDLGANIGSICIPLCKRRPDIKCVAVEAVPWIYGYLQKNINANGLSGSITTLNFALKDVDGEELPFYSTEDSFGKGSLAPVFTDKAIMVNTLTIMSILSKLNIRQVAMIKIDIEGYEYFAFKGAVELLNSADAPQILFEFVDWAEKHAGLEAGAAQQLLIDYGYTLYFMEKGNIPVRMDKVSNSRNGMILGSKNKRAQ